MEAILKQFFDDRQVSFRQETTAFSPDSTGAELVNAITLLSSNEAVDQECMDGFLEECIVDSETRWILKTVFSQETPTTQILATNLLRSASKISHVDMTLLHTGIDVDAPRTKVRGVTVLQAASNEGNLTTVILVLHAITDFDGEDLPLLERGMTSEQAAENCPFDVLSLQLEHDRDVEDLYDRCEEHVLFAAHEGLTVVARMLREFRKG